MKSASKKALVLKTLTKNNVWDLQENDVFRLWEEAQKDPETKDNAERYTAILKNAFIIEELAEPTAMMKSKYEKQGFKVGTVKPGDSDKTWAVKKRPIVRVSDLNYENIHHISASKLIEVLDRNFGGGWDSLSQSTKDIIESGFDISTTTLPKNRLHKPGGMYEKKVADGYEVLEVEKGTWVEAIFAKLKPEMEKPKAMLEAEESHKSDSDEDDDEDIVDNYNKPDEDDIEPEEPTDFSDEDINEENYRTTFEIDGDDEDDEALTDYPDEQ